VELMLLLLGPQNGLLYHPWRENDNECGAVSGMTIGKGNRSTRRKPAPVPLSPPQIPHDLTQAPTQAAVIRNLQLITWTKAWSNGSS
jgi:hypothetical protein